MSSGFFLRFSRTFFNKDSFKPLYTFKKQEDSKFGLIFRILLGVATILYIGFMYINPQSYEGLGDILIESYDEVVDWGKDKMAFNYTKDISNMTITYEDLLEPDNIEEEATIIPEIKKKEDL